MNNGTAFLIFWCAMVVLMGAVNLAWGLNDLRRGSARLYWHGTRVEREEEPFEFWLAVGAKFLAVPVTAFMLWFAWSNFRFPQ
jgi:hypothetical protein